MIVYLTDKEYNPDKCIFCLKPIQNPHKILIAAWGLCFGTKNFIMPEGQKYYGYCGKYCERGKSMAEIIELAAKTTGWELK